ncbi:hypothetical protein [Desulfosporosinus sp. BICA1-9]|uniref:hypothetical protein n=1 Tax=Desulfosporosinus sp. BICA1-9 TaxID=1531958 RepID=UPI00054B7C29|nr:hypothetical protein [Desulfosporosinus sp. BICA1-9]KJS50278.1 MAG: hypothetical protein VR66_03740 [Peptococcaceae bacterium BRH_c23]KJS85096.1 MAG: hypothetical protein JL57_19800 [Desulfosporosinus sp. BICA1-9]HBW34087.1 hypothetical protein [Desulfosporosinus sp.]
MRIFIKILPLFILPILIFISETVFKEYLLNIVSTPNDMYLIILIAIASYMIGLGVAYLCLKVDKKF